MGGEWCWLLSSPRAPPSTESHCAQKSLAEGGGYPPPLTEKIRWVVFDRFPYILTYMPSKLPEDPSNLNILLTTTKKEMIYNIPVNTRWYPLIPVDTRNTRKYPKYPKYPKIPESKRDTRKYPIAYFDTPTRPEPDPIPGILSNTRPDPTRYWKTLPAGHC